MTKPWGIRIAGGIRLAMLLLAGGLTVGCDTWFGADEDPPLPGERISVLAHDRQLSPDPQAQGRRIILPPPVVNPEWPQPGGYANHAMHHLTIADSPQARWTADAGTSSDSSERFVGQPIVAGGRVFTMDSGHLVSAFAAAGGERLWQTPLAPETEEDDGHISGGLAHENGIVFATTGFAQVVALNAATGEEIWWRKFPAPFRAAPTARGGRVFAISLDNTLHVLDAVDGAELWSHTGITEPTSLLGGGSPAVDGGVVVAPFSSGEILAMSVGNGRVLWADSLASARRTDETAALSQIRGHPVVDRGRVLALSHGGVMAAIDTRTGRRLWDREVGGLQTPWVAGSFVYVLTVDAQLLCLSRDDGRITWITELPAFEDEEDRDDPILWTGPVLVSDRLVVVGSHGVAFAISPYTGEYLGAIELSDPVSVPSVVADGTLYVLTDEADLIAFR